MNELDAITMTDPADVAAACEQSVALIYKHSPYCGMSRRAVQEVKRFIETNPGVPVYMVDVVRDRALSQEIATRLGVRHESPQVIVVVDGAAAWDASHGAITAHALAREAGAGDGH